MADISIKTQLKKCLENILQAVGETARTDSKIFYEKGNDEGECFYEFADGESPYFPQKEVKSI